MLAITNPKPLTSSTGGITVTMSILLLLLALGSAVYSAKSELIDIRITNAEYRKNQAILAAESGLSHALAHLDKRGKVLTTLNENVGANSFSVSIAELLDAMGEPVQSSLWENDSVLRLVSTGLSDDASSTSTLEQKVWLHAILRQVPDSAITVAGGIGVGGSFRVGANPNSSGIGVPLSIWSDSPVTLTGNGATCGLEEYDQGACEDKPYSDKTALNADVFSDTKISAGGSFPDDLFEHTFGIPTADYIRLKEQADEELTDCSSLNTASTGLFWVTGDCTINAGTIVADASTPIVLIIEDSDLKMNGGAVIYGLVYVLETSFGSGGKVSMTGNAEIRGAIISDHAIDISSGTLDMRFDAEVLAKIADPDNDIFAKVELIPGSWKDF
ncbi:hypothetical protein [Psychrobium sp. 1_MG-2023]|uniref:hypothetical protein n=1 Tax=Psychrobium sp. 1_MG-2023 TaxID=3062624 RepID=UPI000C3400FE|nr:hypothetical protein [Psychrobium sp. 1_MG-2023]MDP2559642.1 hypothetical protein [Psychrobium sp. 1_MG-2023]PKF59474.1 hypothetical protein CW748_01505 [Alteromonadales bacterium alter-6D02]